MNSIAIGALAGQNNQAPSSIVLNATGAVLNAPNRGFFVAPINSTITTTSLLSYNSTTSEVNRTDVTYQYSGSPTLTVNGLISTQTLRASTINVANILTSNNVSGLKQLYYNPITGDFYYQI